jgi:hypothetical protein
MKLRKYQAYQGLQAPYMQLYKGLEKKEKTPSKNSIET